MNLLNNKLIFFSILITPLLFSQSADDVLLDYMTEEFEKESADYEVIKEKYFNSIEAGEIDSEAAYKVSEYLTKLMIQAGLDESSEGDGLKEMIAKSLQLSVSNGYHKALPNYARLFLFGWYFEEDFKAFDTYMRMAAQKDLIEGISLCCKKKEAINEIFNITYGNSRKINELTEVLKKEFENVKISFSKKEKFMPERGTLNNKKAKDLLGFFPRFPIEDGYIKYIRWYKNFWENLRNAK